MNHGLICGSTHYIVLNRGRGFVSSAAENYRAFAAEAHGRSPQYEELARAVADDPLVLGFLDTLPAAKRQPNLLFAVARYLLGAPADFGALQEARPRPA